MFHYSDTWPLIINTGITMVTFLMVFLIQNTHNRDAKAVHLKLSDDEMKKLEQELERIHQKTEQTERAISKVESTGAR